MIPKLSQNNGASNQKDKSSSNPASGREIAVEGEREKFEMSGTISGFDVNSGERVFNPEPGNEAHNEAFRSDLFETPEWVELQSKFDLESGMEIVNAVIDTVPEPKILSRVQSIIRTVVLAGGLTKFGNLTPRSVVESEPEVEPEIQRDKNGRPLSESQQRWSEYRQFAETHSSQECRDRARVDSGFASFRRLNLERECQETPSTQFELAGQPQSSATKKTSELIAFAEVYRKTPMSEVKKLRNPVFNLNAEQYEQDFQSALAAGLL
jgi:hypothetical protein